MKITPTMMAVGAGLALFLLKNQGGARTVVSGKSVPRGPYKGAANVDKVIGQAKDLLAIYNSTKSDTDEA